MRELGIGFVAYSPLGRGFLSGQIKSFEDLGDDDYRRKSPRFQGAAFDANLRLVARVQELAEEKGVTAGQLTLAWVMSRGVVPIPGTKRVSYVEENVAAADIVLDADDLQRLEEVAPAGAATGDRYADMSTIDA